MTPSPYFCPVDSYANNIRQRYGEEPRFNVKNGVTLRVMCVQVLLTHSTHHHIWSHLDTGRSLDHASCFVHNCPHIGDQT